MSGCRTAEEREAEARRDPITRMRQFLTSEGLATEADLQAIAADVDRDIADATRATAAPRRRRNRRLVRLFARRGSDVGRVRYRSQAGGKPDTMVSAINRTLKDEMARNPRIVVFGEDVADASRVASLPHVPGKGGVFKVTHGLQRQFGSDRVFNSPLAEANIIGRAVGMARAD